MRALAFAIPGDINTLTGGFLYEKRLLEGLRALGHDVRHIELDPSFPDPDVAATTDAVAQLAAIEPARPVILDGLVFGSLDTAGLARVRAPIVAMIHHPLALESGLDPPRAEHLYRTERNNLRHAVHVLVPSPHTRAILIDRYGVDKGRITVARPGTLPPAGPPRPVDPPLILSVGIQHPRKGHDVLMHALARTTDLAWQATVVGKVHDAAHALDLERLMGALGLRDRVRFAGRVPQEEIGQLYREATLFALATRYEGYGIVFDEALVHGLPIVSCATGAVSDTVPPGAGRLVPPDDAAAFADALRDLLSDADARRVAAQTALEEGRRRPSWQDTARTASRTVSDLPG
ncbi:glycosyltransferase family 4 protein [Roseivivax sediminis]|uniref:Glycosyltransferase involved in cell wall bisynthesis n=1 Tax=Roseivivax sediminis TaxID=936889 RepID=A0A1I2DIL3_9RHOB|nr:glycosyltransferase family 4 protein [Roseivivax sediminis]SFE80317.1 Glycosyltransferase involved in cell wall bisynthesis [Roseivivax sediminis]